MASAPELIRRIRVAFANTPYPGDPFLVGSSEGCEPRDAVGPFIGQRDWQSIPLALLEADYTALGFFSEGAFRFFLPAYLVADLEQQLVTVDVLYPLTAPFGDAFGAQFINPRRFGAMTWLDHGRHRFSVFSREESAAILEYLQNKQQQDSSLSPNESAAISQAIDRFWRERAESAPSSERLGSS
jgi:hypothetical protein